MGQNTSKEDKKLMRDYNLKKDELQDLKENFKENCSGGRVLTKTEYRKVYSRLFPGDAEEFADQMFRVADKNKNGEVDFMEFVQSLCMCDSKNIDDKIKIAFALYDKDNNGTISRAEVKDLLKAYSKLEKRDEDSDVMAIEFFRQMDEDENDEVTFEEFKEAAKKDPVILSLLNPKPPEWQD